VPSVINCRTIEAPISKKWYNLFVSLDPVAGAETAEDSTPTVRSPAQTVA